ncbi:hypothetical protein PanWU01x14_137220 [Parasponia andersonii]|uniref:Uncharacterized protein n=1 Tax=Parasponia andersonii TaxID=3476 RepID=A0A2P5CNJ5_PARAD|nr:hypothetical protein PanWU01x14_137220 [Parasponia andersonii]
MRRRELVEFRTPQHPSLGSNHWGGASPLLARNIPKESLERRYLRLNSVRTRDEIIPVFEDEFNCAPESRVEKQEQASKSPSRKGIRGLLQKFMFQRTEKSLERSSNSKKKRWFPRLDSHKRWPQGWC